MGGLERIVTPEERELQARCIELRQLRAELADIEVQVADLSAELGEFAAEFARTVGVHYAETDALRAEIARVEAAQRPLDQAAQDTAQEASERADEIRAAERAATGADQSQNAALRAMFREAARLMHPDRAEDDDRAARTEAMARVNDAYARGDAAEIRRLIREWLERSESIAGTDVAHELVRTLRRIASVKRAIASARDRLEALKVSEWALLRTTVETARREGHDLLAQMTVDARVERDRALETLQTLREGPP